MLCHSNVNLVKILKMPFLKIISEGIHKNLIYHKLHDNAPLLKYLKIPYIFILNPSNNINYRQYQNR